MPVTFKTTDVEPNQNSNSTYDLWDKLRLFNLSGVEALGTNQQAGAGLVYPTIPNGFLNAIHTAFEKHQPLVLSPDDVWLTLAQGFATHVTEHAEELRERFVPGTAAGSQELIMLVRNGFVKGSRDNDWPGCFNEFSDEIGARIGAEKLAMVRASFSTTGPLERAVSELVLMDAMKKYFSYGCMTMCGIPSITLLGELEDWKDVKARASTLGEYGLSWWTAALLPTLDHFIAAFEGRVDKEFWGSIYKYHSARGSGGQPHVSGWVNNFFPYLRSFYRSGTGAMRNSYVTTSLSYEGPTTDEFPAGLSKVPFKWSYYETEFSMEFLGGFIGAQLADGLVRPVQGWAVREAKSGKD